MRTLDFVARRPTGRNRGRPPHPGLLTPAEQRVLELIRERKPYAEIGVRLGITPDGVKYHVSNILGKTGFTNREELAAWNPAETAAPSRWWAAVPALTKFIGAAGAAVGVGAGIWFGLATLAHDSPGNYEPLLITVGYDGTPATGQSDGPAVSADGRFVAYTSSADNLVRNDANGQPDVFIYDRETRTTRLVSVSLNGASGGGESAGAAISADGRFVAFGSSADDLVAGDTNATFDETLDAEGVSARVERQLSAQFGDGDFQGVLRQYAGRDIFVRDMSAGVTVRVSLSTAGIAGNLLSFQASISGDGRYVAFASYATNLVPGDGNLGSEDAPGPYIGGLDIFVRDRATGMTTRVGTGPGRFGTVAAEPSLSPDGRYLAYKSDRSGDDGCTPLYEERLSKGGQIQSPLLRPHLADLVSGHVWCPDLRAGSVYPVVSFATDAGLVAGSSWRSPTQSSAGGLVSLLPFGQAARGISIPEPTNAPSFVLPGDGPPAVSPDGTAYATPLSYPVLSLVISRIGGADLGTVTLKAARVEYPPGMTAAGLSAGGRVVAFVVRGEDATSASVADIYVAAR